jgi:hypothetical protein
MGAIFIDGALELEVRGIGHLFASTQYRDRQSEIGVRTGNV